MPSFYVVFNYSNHAYVMLANRSLITVFPELLKIMAKKAWNFWKWEGKIG